MAPRSPMQRLFSALWPVRVEGLGNVPVSGPVLLAANHSGPLALDAVLILRVLEERMEPGLQRLAFTRSPGRELFRQLFGESCDLRAGGPEEAVAELRGGAAVVVFPEGPAGARKRFWRWRRLEPFGGGFLRIALETAAPVVPVAVTGGEHMYPLLLDLPRLARLLDLSSFPVTPFFPWLGPLGLLPLPSRWTLRFGPPLVLRHHRPEAAADDRLVDELLSEVRGRLQALLTDRLRHHQG